MEIFLYQRKENTKNALVKLRKLNKVPAVMYGKSFENQNVFLAYEDALNLTRGVFKKERLVEVNFNQKKLLTIVKNFQLNSVTDRIEHLDLVVVEKTTRVNFYLPIQCINQNESPGLKLGGVLNFVHKFIKVKDKVENLLNPAVIDLKGAKIGKIFKVQDLKLENCFMNPDNTLLTILAPAKSE